MSIDVAACSAARLQALTDGDSERLAALIADDLRYVHATGVAHDRAAYLEFVRGKLRFLEVRLDFQKIKEFPEVAVITGLLVQRVVRAGESEPVTLSSWAIEVWKRQDAWRLTEFQSTRLPA